MRNKLPVKFQFNWKKHENHIKKLQARIVKAYQLKRYNKAKALRWILKQSLSSKILAIRRVTQNKGKKTAGVDGVIWNTEKQKLNAINELEKVGYKAKPLKRTYINKRNGKKRPLGIPTMKDRAMQAWYLMGLDPIAETILDGNMYGFRKKRSTAEAITSIFKSVRGILEGDIKGCFDNISHQWLIENISIDKKILYGWLKAGIIFNKEHTDTISGVPQGSIISPCLANLTLNCLERILQQKFMKHKKVNGKEINNKVHTIIYADDFVVTGRSKELLEKEVLPVIKEFMMERGLELSEEKTHITHISSGFNFLGQNIRKYNDGKVIIKPTKDNIERFLGGIRETIKSNPTIKQEELIEL
jgi:RNA-directed DNA polymerase